MISPMQRRPLPEARDPYEDPRFRADLEGSTDDEEAEEVSFIASLPESYLQSEDTAEDSSRR